MDDVILKVFEKLPDRFFGWQLAGKVKRIIDRPHMYDDTVLRRLRKLKTKGLLSYSVYKQKSFYTKKHEVKEAGV